MSNRTQFELNYLRDSALIIYVNLQLLFLTVYLNHFWTWKWCHDDTKTSFDFTSVDFYLFLYNETFTYKDLIFTPKKREFNKQGKKVFLDWIVCCGVSWPSSAYERSEISCKFLSGYDYIPTLEFFLHSPEKWKIIKSYILGQGHVSQSPDNFLGPESFICKRCLQ